MQNKIEERFLRYVKINTQSDPDSLTSPSSGNQKKFANILQNELKELGVDASVDDFGYLIATIPANTTRNVPPIFFCAHLDTSPDCSAENVNPLIHRNYDGSDIVLPKDNKQIIKTTYFPELKEKIGMDIITADGSTLLGADNKAGVSELMEVVRQFTLRPEIKHGEIKILFTPDEEIGKDTVHLTVEKIGAKYGYSIDGHALATINDQTFFVAGASVEIYGSTIHTGKGDGIMENAIKIAMTIIQKLPANYSPEQAKEKDGFIHPSKISGNPGKAIIRFQIRAFEEAEIAALSDFLEGHVRRVVKDFGRSGFKYSFKLNDRNINETLKKYPILVEVAKEAIRKTGLQPLVRPLRGSTTGASLAVMGLPCANIFTGQHGVHGKLEWVCVQDMEKAVEAILNICEVWEQKGGSA